ncbi:carbonic anhydrase [Myxococcus sp. AM009]|uniref:carbonic anhydrase n=1 Tax=unclassified Myxococcus TaxID=2648731 RepID=UPI0015956D24|nr:MULTISPECIES: carbonic anhydrase [unclassified Myxococcus]NVI99664.1 carbonic anhydrase [Myxococcus sp. AM009]NVJ15804.1 carbonic anhydrase [Myxococcus sp. AM010]
MPTAPTPPLSAQDALAQLREGNQRFVMNVRSVENPLGRSARQALVAGQSPFAIILSCSDSRAPSEYIFDQGLGDLFVIRVAGNVVAPSLVGSVEFAAAEFGTRLAVVMGHSHCGAIKATLDSVRNGTGAASDNIRDIVERCREPVTTVVSAAGPKADPEFLLKESVRANIRNSCDHLRHGSRLLERLCREEGMRIVGAEYSLETGVVDFFNGV